MNDGCQPTTETQVPSGGCAGRQFIAIIIAAFALGLVYNLASPLGVRAPKTETPVASPPERPHFTNHHSTALAGTNVTTGTAKPVAAPTTISSATLRWTEVKPLLESGEITLVDARTKTAYDLEHIPGAMSLPTESAPEAFVAFAIKYPPDTAIVVYCSGENCDLSHELGVKLKQELGYKNVREMPGGIVEYRLAEGKQATPATK